MSYYESASAGLGVDALKNQPTLYIPDPPNTTKSTVLNSHLNKLAPPAYKRNFNTSWIVASHRQTSARVPDSALSNEHDSNEEDVPSVTIVQEEPSVHPPPLQHAHDTPSLGGSSRSDSFELGDINLHGRLSSSTSDLGTRASLVEGAYSSSHSTDQKKVETVSSNANTGDTTEKTTDAKRKELPQDLSATEKRRSRLLKGHIFNVKETEKRPEGEISFGSAPVTPIQTQKQKRLSFLKRMISSEPRQKNGSDTMFSSRDDGVAPSSSRTNKTHIGLNIDEPAKRSIYDEDMGPPQQSGVVKSTRENGKTPASHENDGTEGAPHNPQLLAPVSEDKPTQSIRWRQQLAQQQRDKAPPQFKNSPTPVLSTANWSPMTTMTSSDQSEGMGDVPARRPLMVPAYSPPIPRSMFK